MSVKVLIVDDTVVYRKIVSDILANQAGIEVVGTAANGKIALQKIDQLKPDLLTLDMEMPEMDGLDVLKKLQQDNNPIGAIMLSSFTSKGAETTIAALKHGAFDFVLKPSGTTIDESVSILRDDLIFKIRAFADTKLSNIIARKTQIRTIDQRVKKLDLLSRSCPKVVAIGISTGGPKALTAMLPELPGDFPIPILIVQHMPPMFTKSLADDLDRKCKMSVSEAAEGESVLPGHIYIAPGGRQMKVKQNNGNVVICITDDPPENNCKPAVDYLFRSVSMVYGKETLAVIMTGMGTDGTLGCKLLKRKGASILTQDEETSVVYGMPKGPAEAGIVDVVSPLNCIAEEIMKLITQGSAV